MIETMLLAIEVISIGCLIIAIVIHLQRERRDDG
jgi:preprotein translocase subunit SecG